MMSLALSMMSNFKVNYDLVDCVQRRFQLDEMTGTKTKSFGSKIVFFIETFGEYVRMIVHC